MTAALRKEADAAVASGTSAIHVDGVAQVFRRGDAETRAIERIDLSIAAGEFISVVGPSGCGKSTLMRIISGLLMPSQGQVLINGRPVKGPYTDLGIVFQQPVLLDWRSILDNVLLQVELRSQNPAEYAERGKALLEAVGLGDFHDRYPYELSGGMQQRAAICRALIHDPPILLMDEPFGALDALTREQMRVDLEELWLSTRKTVIFITHSIDEAVLLSDRVVVMSPRPGKVERVIDIDLARPRGLEARRSPRFTQIVEEITGIFLSRGVLRRGRSALAGTIPRR
ncbi:MAG: ABC transporter ATP-binding protein [Alphaproteobacteria bacterium]|nr:ABC transporter ATP-binding protein [Alphaproteobacteria bacterium]